MATEKRILMVAFKPDKLKSTKEMRELFAKNYPKFLDMESVESKCWWCNQKEQEFGAFYIFKSEEALNKYLSSEEWQKNIPERWGCMPTWNVFEPGLILSKKKIINLENSWLSD